MIKASEITGIEVSITPGLWLTTIGLHLTPSTISICSKMTVDYTRDLKSKTARYVIDLDTTIE